MVFISFRSTALVLWVFLTLAGLAAPPSLYLFPPIVQGCTVFINGVTLPGTPDSAIQKIVWEWGDGTSEEHWFAASHRFRGPGTYTIRVTSVQSDGLSTTQSVTVTVCEKTILLIVEDRLHNIISGTNFWTQFLLDIYKLGYTPLIEIVASSTHPTIIKQLIQNYFAIYNISGALLIGNIRAAYIINRIFGEQYRTEIHLNACDMYYMDLDGLWVEIEKPGFCATRPPQVSECVAMPHCYSLQNEYIVAWAPENVWEFDYEQYIQNKRQYECEIWVSRIMAHNLEVPNKDEITILREYFEWVHSYLHARNHGIPNTAYILDEIADSPSDDPYNEQGMNWEGIFNPIYKADCVSKSDYITFLSTPQGSEFFYITVHSAPHLHWFSHGGALWVDELLNINKTSAFYLLNACSSCRWDQYKLVPANPNYLGGVYVFAKTHPSGDYGIAALGFTGVGGHNFLKYFSEYLQAYPGASYGDAYKYYVSKLIHHIFRPTNFVFLGFPIVGPCGPLAMPNIPPGRPTPRSPLDGEQVLSLTPELVATDFQDLDGDIFANSHWQVDDDADFSSPEWDSGEAYQATTQVTVPAGRLAYNITYWWRVRYKDSRGAWSSWSQAQRFTTQAPPNNPPATPSLVSPADGATGLPLTPTLQASAFSDPDGDGFANSHWQVDNNSDFSSPEWDSGEAYQATTQVTVPAGRLAYSTTYWWRVRYKDGRGAWSSWSPAWRFTTQAPPSCSVPIPNTPIGPASGYVGQSYVYSTGGPTTCTNGHSLEYRFDWGDGTYSSWSSSTTASKAWTSPGTYNVRAQARCAVTKTEGPWSTALTVTIVSLPPSEVIFIEDFEDISDWTSSGLWHLAYTDSTCVDCALLKGRFAHYARQDTCNYEVFDPRGRTTRTQGTLLSPYISIPQDKLLTIQFDYFREVEKYTRSTLDRTYVQIRLGRESRGRILWSSWRTILSRSSRDDSPECRTVTYTFSSGRYAYLQIRFTFDSVNGRNNHYRGWAVDNLVVKHAATATLALLEMGDLGKGWDVPDEVEIDDLEVISIPNPVRDVRTATFFVFGIEAETVRVEVYDLSGRLVWKAEAPGNELVWHTEDLTGLPLANGVYIYLAYVKVDDEWIRVGPQKLVILR